MSIRLVLDAHIPLAVARRLRDDGVDAAAASDWHGGQLRSAPDDVLLSAATSDARILATYDCRTIPLLLKEWAETGRHHQGVILIDERTVPAHDVGGLLRSFRALLRADEPGSWEDRVVFLLPVPKP